jgi:small subunit ribosomal protein S5
MPEDNKIINPTDNKVEAEVKNEQNTDKGAALAVAKSVYGERRKFARRGGNRRGSESDKRDEFDQRILDLARVTRVMAGGKRMRFRACVVIGDKKGKVAIGMGKGADVTLAVNKAVNRAKKNMVDVPMVDGTIPHEIYEKYGAAKILFKPAAKGRGVIAGGAVRVILEMAGIKNITSKILGTNNKVNNAKCTISALRKLKRVNAESNVEVKERVVQANVEPKK